MTKKQKIFLVLCGLILSIYSQFAPQVGQTGCTAIKADSSIIVSWATGCQVDRGFMDISTSTAKASYGSPSRAIGKADGTYGVVSLGDKGSAIATFDRPIVNGTGADFAVFENGFTTGGVGYAFLEIAFVEVSSDGKHFVRFPAVSNVPNATQLGGFGAMNGSLINNFAGKYIAGYGTPFDLDELKDSANIDINNIRYVKVIDVCGSINPLYASHDSKGNIVNDPYSTPFASSGFDFDAVAIIHAGAKDSLSTFKSLNLPKSSFWKGEDGAGSFSNGLVKFSNAYDKTYGSWSGFAYSSMIDTATEGYTNQFSVYNKSEMGGIGDTAFAVGYIPLDWTNYKPIPIEASFTDNKSHKVVGFYAANATYTALSALRGDSYAKKFGGSDGNDKDSLVLIVRGLDASGNVLGSVRHYLADFRNNDNTKDFVQTDWRWVDLSSLGEVHKLDFSMESSDNGTYGANTPLYFCLDNLTVVGNGTSTAITNNSKNTISSISLYPNPCVDYIYVESLYNSIVSIYNISGQLIYNQSTNDGVTKIDTKNWNSGCYVVVIKNSLESKAFKIIKR